MNDMPITQHPNEIAEQPFEDDMPIIDMPIIQHPNGVAQQPFGDLYNRPRNSGPDGPPPLDLLAIIMAEIHHQLESRRRARRAPPNTPEPLNPYPEKKYNHLRV